MGVEELTLSKKKGLNTLDSKLAVYERKLKIHKKGSYKHAKYTKRIEFMEYKYGLESLGHSKKEIRPKLKKLAQKHKRELRLLKKELTECAGHVRNETIYTPGGMMAKNA